MSHSIRQKLVHARRFDIHSCAGQIADLVAHRVFQTPDNIVETIYSYDGDCIETVVGKEVVVMGDRLSGEFFDTFPGIEIEIKIVKSPALDVDGYYYHTLDLRDDDGLVEIVACINSQYVKQSKAEHFKKSIQSILSHEMQHVVQRCYEDIDMAQLHDTPEDHLNDFREIDARIEEVLCGIEETDLEAFRSKMSAYIYEYCKRNKMDNVDIDQSTQQHVDFYTDKILRQH
jgi:hypothetical protein